MGSSESLPLPRYSCCILPQNPDHCRENHARATPSVRRRPTKCRRRRYWPRWSTRSRHRLVEDGNVDEELDDDDPMYGRLDINTATAEELMTLPGINRATATNVVAYRAQIGAFRKVIQINRRYLSDSAPGLVLPLVGQFEYTPPVTSVLLPVDPV